MNKADFKREIIDYIDKTYDCFVKYQSITQEILEELDRVSQKNHIDYFLAYGTLLGAIRDQCQIPWDYDVDTFVKITDRERLIDALNTDLGKDFFYDYVNKSSNYPVSCLRICKKGYSIMALHVDVFFLIGTPNNDKERALFIKHAENAINLRMSKYISHYINERPKSKIGRLYSVINKLRYKFVPGCFVRILENRIQKKYCLESSDYWYSYQDTYDKVYSKHIFSETTRIVVGGHTLSVPSGFEEFLLINYGNWHKYLPIRSRFEEFYEMKLIVDERQSQYKKGMPNTSSVY